MNSVTLRKVVWEEMLYADMRANYFGELVRTYQQWDRGLRVAVLVASSSAAATALSDALPIVKVATPVLAAVGSFWLLLSQYTTLARDASDLHAGWSAAAKDYEKVWNQLDDPEAESKFNQIYEKAEGLSRAGNKFPTKNKRLEYWLDHASQLATARYA
jgi:hypothetical protein